MATDTFFSSHATRYAWTVNHFVYLRDVNQSLLTRGSAIYSIFINTSFQTDMHFYNYQLWILASNIDNKVTSTYVFGNHEQFNDPVVLTFSILFFSESVITFQNFLLWKDLIKLTIRWYYVSRWQKFRQFHVVCRKISSKFKLRIGAN